MKLIELSTTFMLLTSAWKIVWTTFYYIQNKGNVKFWQIFLKPIHCSLSFSDYSAMTTARYRPTWDLVLDPLVLCKLCLGEYPVEQMTTIAQCQCIFCTLVSECQRILCLHPSKLPSKSTRVMFVYLWARLLYCSWGSSIYDHVHKYTFFRQIAEMLLPCI